MWRICKEYLFVFTFCLQIDLKEHLILTNSLYNWTHQDASTEGTSSLNPVRLRTKSSKYESAAEAWCDGQTRENNNSNLNTGSSSTT